MTEYSQTYWNELIEQYKQGSISDQDRFLLEKQALDDPFLFDALEGYSLYQSEEVEQKKTTKLLTLPRIAIAASIVLLIAFVFNMNNSSQITQEQDSPIAMVIDDVEKEQTIPEPKNTSPQKTEEEPEAIPTDNKINAKKKSTLEDQSQPASTSPEKVNTPEQKMDNTTSEIASSEDLLEDKVPDVEEEIEVLNTTPQAIRENNDAIVRLDETENNANQTSSNDSKDGKVVEPPLKMEKTDSANSLQEVSQSKRKKELPKIYYEAIPVIGKKIFDEYANEKIDKRGYRREIPHEVTIEFSIDKNGMLTDFKHIFNGCSECGSFAISILTTSGEWKTVPPGLSGRARYTFIF
ncbi:MAG: hypothetical protein P1U56_13265 [Saprospiraceae bacterium]|nr:hypothetical protein [Saprospiraceae bacterium]